MADIDLDGKKITITGSTAVIQGERATGQPRAAEHGSSPSMTTPFPSSASAMPTRPPSNCKRATPGAEPRTGTGSDRMGRTDLPRYRHVTDDKLIRTHNLPGQRPCPKRPATARPATRFAGVSTRRPCCSLACPFMSSPSAWATPTRLSPCACTRTSYAAPRPLPQISSPRPSRPHSTRLLADPLAKGHFLFEHKDGSGLLAGSRLSESNR